MAMKGGQMATVALQNSPTVLLCQPCDEFAHSIFEYLRARGLAVGRISESQRAVDQIITRAPDAVLLDSRIPPAGGYDVCKEIRPSYSGTILFMGWARDEAAQLLAYERGADVS